MAEYINRSDAIREAIEAADEWDGGYVTSREKLIAAYLNDMPAADVRENVRGEWILDDDDDYYELWKCSHCGQGIFDHRYDFCPHCGADMRGGVANV